MGHGGPGRIPHPPTRQAFLDMIASTEYQEIGHLRTEALVKGELHPMDAGEVPTFA